VPDLPFLNVCSVSTTPEISREKITGRRRSRKGARRVAAPTPGFRLYGRACPVRLTCTPRIGAEVYIEVETSEGRFWVHQDASLLDLITRVQQGGFSIEPRPSTTRRR